MKQQLHQLKNFFLQSLSAVKDKASLESLEIKYLGRKSGELTNLMKGLKDLSAEEKRAVGQLANEVKSAIEKGIEQKRKELRGQDLAWLGEKEWVDVTAPGLRPPEGHLHLVTQAIREITQIFERLGFVRRRYPEVEWDWYAFESLNMPVDHPARDEWETFFVEGPLSAKFGCQVLTPHTSSGQVREMERQERPIRMINISKCYRRQIDVSHVPMFHQFEGLMIDKFVPLTYLKGVIEYFVKAFFGPGRQIRLRPFHFRFTEPSFEIDVSCGVCQGRGYLSSGEKCRLCKGGWLELAGAGLVHPHVLKAGGVDPRKYSGFAFGFGVERCYMMKSGLQLPDIRLIYQNDLSFLEQF